MDTFTHGVTGLAIGLAGGMLSRRPEGVMPFAVSCTIAGVLPDLDAVTYLIDVELYYRTHRLYTHTIFALPVLAFFSAGAVWLKYRSGFILMYGLCALTLVVHLLEDLVCDWPILLLWPLSERDFALDWVKYTSYCVLGIMGAVVCVLLYLIQPEKRNKNYRGL